MKGLGIIMWVGAGIVLWLFMVSSFYGWWGDGGVIAGFILAPGVVIFPIIYWIKEGFFPIFYFIVWGIGILGLIIAGISSKNN